MALSQNLFDDLIPDKQNVANVASDVSAPESSENAFDDLVPQAGAQAQTSAAPLPAKPMASSNIFSIQPGDEGTLPQRGQAVMQGLREAGQGFKQAYLAGKESLGYAPTGTAQSYTKEAEAQRRAYGATPGGQNRNLNLARSIASNTPALLTGALPLTAEGLLAKMVLGGAVGGGLGATSFVPSGGDRVAQTALSTVAGAAIPAAMDLPSLVSSFAKRAASPIRSATANIEPEKMAAESAQQEATQAIQEHEAAKAQAQVESGVNNPNLMMNKLNKARADLQNLAPTKVETLPIPSTEASAKNVSDTVAEHENAKTNLANIEDQMSQHLNQGAVHDVRVAASADKTLNDNRRAISSGYDALENDFKKRNVEIDNTDAIQKKSDEIQNLIKNNFARSPEMNKALNELDSLKQNQSVNASDYLRALRSTSQYAREARQKAYTPGLNAEERYIEQQKYNDLDDKVDEMKKALESGVGSDNMQQLKSLNDAWRTQVVPLQKNPIYQKLHYSSQMPADIMKALRGKEPGNVLIKNAIQSDPEALRNVVGQRYAENPADLHSANEGEQEYINKMPELKNMMEQHKAATQRVAESKNAVDQAQLVHEKSLAQEAKAQKLSASQQKKATKQAALKDKLIEDIKQLEKHIPILKDAASKKGLSLQKKMQAQRAYSEALEKKKAAQTKLWVVAGSLGIPVVEYKIAKYLFKDNPGE